MTRRITREWNIDIEDEFQRRIENESLVFSKPGRTIYINVWDRPEGEDKEQTLDWIKSETNSTPLLRREFASTEILCYGYLLKEFNDGREYYALYGFSVADTSYVQIACYYDQELDISWAERTWLSLSYQAEE